MKVIENPTSGPQGFGDIKVLDNNRVQVRITDKEGNSIEEILEYPQGVENVRIKNWPLQDATDLRLSLTADKNDFKYTPGPRNGTFYVKFARFGAEPGEIPTIRWERGKEWKGEPWLPDRYKFFALYEVLNPGPYQGMEIMDSLTYEFEWDENLEEFTIVASRRKKYHEHLLRFLNVFGFDLQNDVLHYTAEDYDAGGETTIPNVLPELEDILRDRNRLAQVTVSEGWVDEETLQLGPYGMTEESLMAALGSKPVEKEVVEQEPLFPAEEE